MDRVFVVFEDDAQIPPNFEKHLKESMAALPVDWEYAYFGRSKKHNIVGENVNEFWLRPHNTTKQGENALLHCCIVNGRGASKLLNFMHPITHSHCADVFMRRNFDKFNAYFYRKMLVFKDKGQPSK